MAMVTVTPTPIEVRCGWLDGRPRGIKLADEYVSIVRIDGVREESAAYRADRGPRTIFDVSTPDARLRLAFEHHTRRWLLEALDEDRQLAPAA
jgi:hypothetical protein